MPDRTTAPDVVIIGAGIIGLATAWELARRGVAVTVVERGTPGQAATWAAGGMLAPLAEARRPGPLLELSLAALERYAAFAEAVRDASGIDVEYTGGGKLVVAMSEAEEAKLREQCEWQRASGFAVELMDGDEAHRREPALSLAVRAALFLPLDCQVENRRLAQALWLATARAGVEFRLGVGAAGVRTSSAADAGRRGRGARRSPRARVLGVVLADGELIAAERVIVAAGSWSGQLDGLPRDLPVEPVRGQMLAVETIPPVLRRVVLTPGCYLIPRAGRVIVGATMERVGFRSYPTPAGVHSLLDAAVQAVPALAQAPLLEVWAGLRPGTPDDLPILGPDPAADGLFYATGHFRNGVLLAPVTADILADLVTGETPELELAAFGPERFDEGAA